MIHVKSPAFNRLFEKLPNDVQGLAKKNFALLVSDAGHPSLQFKRVGKRWSVRVGLQYRAVAIERDKGRIVWVWIGTHNDFDTLARSFYK